MNTPDKTMGEFATRLSKELDLRMGVYGNKQDRYTLTEWNDIYGFSWIDINIAPYDEEQEDINMSQEVFGGGDWHSLEDCDEDTQAIVKDAREKNLSLVWVELAIRDMRHKVHCRRYIIRPLAELFEAWVFDKAKEWLDEQRANRIDEEIPYLAETLNIINRLGYDRVDCNPDGDCIVVGIKGKYGLISMHGESVCEVKYDAIDAVEKGKLMSVGIDGKYGFINSKGEEIIPLEYDAVGRISDGCVAVCLNGKWGFVTLDNKVVIPFEYDDAGKFSCELANVKKGDKWGYINEQNEMVMACKYDWCDTFRNGEARVLLNDEYSTIDTEGNTVESQENDNFPF